MINRRRFLTLSLSLLTAAACTQLSKHRRPASGSTILALGDSLTAGYGAEQGQDYPAQLTELTGYKTINGGISGDTSAQALARLPALMKQKPQLVIVSIGGNDFLKKLPENQTRENIGKILSRIREADVPAVLVAIPHFTTGALLGFIRDHPLYRDLAKQYAVPLLENAWSEILGKPHLKSDPIHANAAGYRLFAEKTASFLRQEGLI